MYRKYALGRWGFVDRGNEWVIPPRYLYAGNFYGGIAKVELTKSRECLIDINGNIVVEYVKMESYISEGLFLFRTDSELMAGYIKDNQIREEKPVSALERKAKMYDKLLLGKAAYYIKKPLRRVVYYDHIAETICITKLPGRPSSRLTEHRFAVRNLKENTMRCFDIEQHALVGPIVNRYVGYSEGLYCTVNQEGKYQFLDNDWNDVLGEFDEAWPFSNGLSPIRRGNKYTVIDRLGNDCFSFSCDELLHFDSETKWSVVTRDDDYFLIDQHDDVIIGPVYTIDFWQTDYPFYDVCLSRGELDSSIIYDRYGKFITRYTSE